MGMLNASIVRIITLLVVTVLPATAILRVRGPTIFRKVKKNPKGNEESFLFQDAPNSSDRAMYNKKKSDPLNCFKICLSGVLMPIVRQRPFLIGTVVFIVSLWALLYLFSTAMAANKEINGLAQVLSANLILIKGKTIRLFGIHAPQLDQICKINGARMRCGVVAWAELIRIADGAYLSCDVEKTKDGKTGVKVATCYSGEHDIGESLVRTGYARALISQSDRYRVDQEDAKQSVRGLWAGEYFSVADDVAVPLERKGNKKLERKKANGLIEESQAAIVPKTSSAASPKGKNNSIDVYGRESSKKIIKGISKKKTGKQQADSPKGTSKEPQSNAVKTKKVHLSGKPLRPTAPSRARGKKTSKRQSLVAEENTALQEASEINAVKEDLVDNAELTNEAAPMSRGAGSFFQRIFGVDTDNFDDSQEF